MNFITNLAALMFYDEKGVKTSFEKLSDEERKPYIARAQKVVIFMDKLNLEPAKKQDPDKLRQSEAERIDALRLTIQEFVKGLKHPKGVAQFFPCEELARKINKEAK
jgi:hypothetical protein